MTETWDKKKKNKKAQILLKIIHEQTLFHQDGVKKCRKKENTDKYVTKKNKYKQTEFWSKCLTTSGESRM